MKISAVMPLYEKGPFVVWIQQNGYTRELDNLNNTQDSLNPDARVWENQFISPKDNKLAGYSKRQGDS